MTFPIRKWAYPAGCVTMAIIIIFLAGCGRRCAPAIEIQGEIQHRIENDTLLIDYRLRPSGVFLDGKIDYVTFALHQSDKAATGPADSALLSDSLIYRAWGHPLLTEDELSAYTKDYGRCIDGHLRYTLNGHRPPDCFSITCQYHYTDSCSGDTVIVDTVISDSPVYPLTTRPVYYYALSLGISWFHKIRYLGEESAHEVKPLLAGEFFQRLVVSRYAAIDFRASIGREAQAKRPLIHSEYGNLGITFFPFDFYAGSSSIHVSGTYSRLKFHGSSTSRVRSDWAAEIGAGYHGRFEDITYRYAGDRGGYHRVDCFLAVFSMQDRGKLGTVFSIYLGDEISMFQVKACMYGTFETRSLAYFNDRPLVHKILGALPFLPFFLLFNL